MSYQNLKQEKGVEIALAYLREVKHRCKKPKIFNEFCETMKLFKRKEITESFCHNVVKSLFKDDPELLEGFYVYFPKQSSSSTFYISTTQEVKVDNKENNTNHMNIKNQVIVNENDNKLDFRVNDRQSHIIISTGEEKMVMIDKELENENISNINQGTKTEFINEFYTNFRSPKKEASDLSTVISNSRSSSFSQTPSPQSSFKNVEIFDDDDNMNLLMPSSFIKKKDTQLQQQIASSSPASNSSETGLRRSTRNRKVASKPVDDAYVFYK
ncbi:13484_t:CDS:2 [Funneliformis geosporum]|uniref:5500_t:CDS:1 n=1 Tax=Funneliformis geosporum TaxID=1117311 RepID=A0A9W4X225_9GLOM|nr:13484_t:CDS:2 [Funneliformis geosporum]CAI2189522.1 5500_t:CDS:2 [Funneliformis geosporum]